ncbi:MAG: hypothetical protein Q7J84_15150 [Sulfuricaulis sp.]|nr:hypothetical protein [Sulfuricaulis sp.]
MNHIKLKKVSLKNHSQYNERWLHDVIGEDPSILGIGDVVVKDRERVHVGAGRLDLLLQDADGYGRYEVEIQLGPTDESHIIRTIEYWDIERRRYPQYDHTAVIVAEDITSRFLNVIGLFNGFIPIMALQVSAIETTDGVGLHFTKVLDTVRLGLLDEDEETAELTDRNYWESIRGTGKTVKLADSMLDIAREFAPSAEQSYNKYYIGFWVEGKACNFAICRPQKNALRLEIRLPKETEYDQIISQSGLDVLDYDKRWGNYKFRLSLEDIEKHRDTIKNLMLRAYNLRK